MNCVFLNGASLLSDVAANHDPVYWNNLVNVAGTNAAFVSGERAWARQLGGQAAWLCLAVGALRPQRC